MSRTIELTTTLSLAVDDGQTGDGLRREVDHRLRAAFGAALAETGDAVRMVALHDPDGTLTQPPYLFPLLSRFGAVASIWSVSDVLELRPDLTPSQATAVLQHVLDTHEVRHGPGWDDFEATASDLFGEPPVKSRVVANRP